VEYPVDRKSFRIVERTQKIGLGILRQMKDVSNGVPEKRQDDGSHDRAESLIDSG
jgi:putative component of toxin-antitoxin plasmid stabilization module